ncbi:MAG TPA: hypothetical protein VGS21_01145, partial [Acidimicrobiales bacterium]|nr:hypothetical protein [Acidimicrobiales bacterium]
MTIDRAEFLRNFDETMRRSPAMSGPGTQVVRDDRWTLVLGEGSDAWSAVVWSGLDEATADDAIAEVIARLGGLDSLPADFEWKYYAHDLPADLPARLEAAGLRPDEEEAVVVAEISAVAGAIDPVPGIEVRGATDAGEIADLVRVHDEAFGEEHEFIGKMLLAELELPEQERTQFGVVAYSADDGRAVSAARVELNRESDIASLWGGGTIPSWRGRGVYRATVAWRAAFAA